MENKTKKITVVDVQRFGQKLIIPEGMSYNEAIEALHKQNKYEETNVSFSEEIKGYFVLDAAFSFYCTLLEQFGMVHQAVTPSFFGDKPPRMIQVAVAEDETAQIPWGRITLPSMEGGYAETGIGGDSRGAFLLLQITVKRKYSEIVKTLLQKTRLRLKKHSIYSGKAIEVRFRNDNKDHEGELLPFPEIKFMTGLNVKEENIILNHDVKLQVIANLLTPIRRTKECEKFGIPTKRGVLLAGDYGAGKSLIASLVASVAVDNKFTFVYIRDPKEFGDAHRVVEYYNPAVVFCEDIDPLMAVHDFKTSSTELKSGNVERDQDMNLVLNILDGIETKGRSVITVLTTNYLDKIHKAFLRPGRLDAVIIVDRPNKDSVLKLIHLYGKDLLLANEDFNPVAEILIGQQPAVIREVVERGKLLEISLSDKPLTKLKLSAAALQASASQMTKQMELLNKQ